MSIVDSFRGRRIDRARTSEAEPVAILSFRSGAADRGRTDTDFTPLDFESS